MRYYLLWHPGTNRMVIDHEKLKGYDAEKQTTASCWIEAKKKFGFELTPLQTEMLNAKNNSDQACRRLLRDLEDAGAELRTADGSMQGRSETGEAARDCVQ